MAIIKQDVKLYILECLGDRSLSMYDFSENDSLYSCLGSVTVPVEYDEADLIDPRAAQLAQVGEADPAVNDLELPGMWESADFLGGETDCQDAAPTDGAAPDVSGLVAALTPLPCPFCGSTDVGGAGGKVNCYKCNAQIAVQNANTHYATQLWNRRVSLQAQVQAAPDVSGLVEALEWYAEHAAGCRKISSEGDKYRSALDRDGGSIAETALSTYREKQGEQQ